MRMELIVARFPCVSNTGPSGPLVVNFIYVMILFVVTFQIQPSICNQNGMIVNHARRRSLPVLENGKYHKGFMGRNCMYMYASFVIYLDIAFTSFGRN